MATSLIWSLLPLLPLGLVAGTTVISATLTLSLSAAAPSNVTTVVSVEAGSAAAGSAQAAA